MNILDREIMTALLKPQPSKYELWKTLNKKYPYATILRHIEKLEKSSLITTQKAKRKNGKLDNRKTVTLSLTDFGLATIIMKGSLNDKEYKLATEKLLPKEFAQIRFLARGLGITSEVILKSIFDKVKPKMNLEYFNQEYFEETFLISFAETLIEIYRNMTDSKREKLKQIAMQSTKETHGKYVSITNELTNEILSIVKQKQHKFDTMAKVLEKAMRSVEKSS